MLLAMGDVLPTVGDVLLTTGDVLPTTGGVVLPKTGDVLPAKGDVLDGVVFVPLVPSVKQGNSYVFGNCIPFLLRI